MREEFFCWWSQCVVGLSFTRFMCEYLSCRDVLLFAVKPAQQMTRRRTIALCLIILMQPCANSLSLPAWQLLGTSLLRAPGEEWEVWTFAKCSKHWRTELCFFFSVVFNMKSFGKGILKGIKYNQQKFSDVVDYLRTGWLNLNLVSRSLSQTWVWFST